MYFIWIDDERNPPGDGYEHIQSLHELKEFFEDKKVTDIQEIAFDYHLGIGKATGADCARWLLEEGFDPDEARCAILTKSRQGRKELTSILQKG